MTPPTIFVRMNTPRYWQDPYDHFRWDPYRDDEPEEDAPWADDDIPINPNNEGDDEPR